MNPNLIAASLITAATVGIGYGTCCSPLVSSFLSAYSISHSDNIRSSLLTFFSFFLGKVLSVTALCIIAALLSSRFITQEGYIGIFNIRLFSQIMMSVIGIALILKWFKKENSHSKCQT